MVTDTPVVPDGEAEPVETQTALELAWVFDPVVTDAALDSGTGAVVDTSEVDVQAFKDDGGAESVDDHVGAG